MIIRQLMTKQSAKRLMLEWRLWRNKDPSSSVVLTGKSWTSVKWNLLSSRLSAPKWIPDTLIKSSQARTFSSLHIRPRLVFSKKIAIRFILVLRNYESKASLNSQKSYMSIKSTGQVNSDQFDLKSFLGWSPDLKSPTATSNENLTHCY